MKLRWANNLRIYVVLMVFVCPSIAFIHFKTTPDSPIHITDNHKLEYKIQPNGDRVPDYSYCGYMASESSLPNVPVKLIISETKTDATLLIQSAINYVSSLPLNKNGFRGAILLSQGTYKISGSLLISESGVVIRGSGNKNTVLLATGTNRETLIRVAGKSNRKLGNPITLEKKYFPVNTTTLTFSEQHSFKKGDKIIIKRPSTKEWIESIGADKIGAYVDYPLTVWEPGDFDMNWDRTIVDVSSNFITIDAPLTNSIDPKYGEGTVSRYDWDGRIQHVGVENVRCVSTFDESNTKDENHRWMAITMENISDSWVRRMDAENFVSSAVAIWETANRITVEDCKSLNPIGEIGNYRRYSFQTLGQQVLFQRCYAEYGYHAFSVGFTTPGPNAFVQCYSYMPYNFSGAVGGWSSGILFDKMTVDGGNISFDFRDVDGQGGGWSTANSFCWQGRAAQIHLCKPPEVQNWAYGSWAQGYGKGHHELQHTFIKPESLYYAQLKARTGKKSDEEDKILLYQSSETTAPITELTAKYSERSKSPDLIMDVWIEKMIEKYPIDSDVSNAEIWNEAKVTKAEKTSEKNHQVELINGKISLKGKMISEGRDRTSLWRGSTRPSQLKRSTPNLVRFVPGRIGRGLTDDLDTLVADMKYKNVSIMQSFPSLWYERRRDDHARTRRADADVWAPFYEQPFSRSGQGEAFDRLSKYDLTKWNSWYWIRLKQFSDLADKNGLLFVQEHYLQHNIIEEGAHWADYPWRTANNINRSGFAENPSYAGDKRIYMAEAFYDTTNTLRKQLHKDYIRKSLDNFKDNTNIIHHLGWEYTGPVHFVEFWLDVIAEWENENNKKVLVMLPGTKDVQDAILSDPKRTSIVNVIDILQWKYRADGTLYAPPGGVSLAGRQYARIYNPGDTSFDQIYRAVREYRLKYPDKAVVYSQRGSKYSNWATFLAGGSLMALPKIESNQFFKDAFNMEYLSNNELLDNEYVLGKKGLGYIVFSSNSEVKMPLNNDSNTYKLDWINPATGELIKTNTILKDITATLKSPIRGEVVAWLHK
ncbi:DUF6298 domain-containing protein [Thalassobellus suaedae]|uniref:DUF6298 domain-containing protein n=1 Tax=Thalassobellus suaedae TaxID=3074124 RepID=A0ABY9XZV6_9FLAO|nr:DUF6298 domain-containing protein [Flavobacteriaceae bacterium HL-DH10]